MSWVFFFGGGGMSVKDLPGGPSGDCLTCACKAISSLFA